MRTVLLHLDEHDSLTGMMNMALQVARRFGGHVEGLHVRPGVPRMVPVSPEGAGLATTELIESLDREEQRLSRRVRERFETFMKENGVTLGSVLPPTDQPSASWRETVSPGDETLAGRGRAFDLIVVGKPVEGPQGPRMSTLESALFESGRPVLMAPHNPPEKLGEVVAIGWNGSTETARTISSAMPFLHGARDVLVVSVEEGMVTGPSSKDVAQNLIRNGIAARARHVRNEGRAIGAVILDEAAQAGADLLLKGAYTHSRLRQMIFGGATSHILAHTTLPVILTH